MRKFTIQVEECDEWGQVLRPDASTAAWKPEDTPPTLAARIAFAVSEQKGKLKVLLDRKNNLVDAGPSPFVK